MRLTTLLPRPTRLSTLYKYLKTPSHWNLTLSTIWEKEHKRKNDIRKKLLKKMLCCK